MTSRLSNCGYTAPILVLGLGNALSGDDGIGSTLLKELAGSYRYAGGFVEFMDGRTRGVELLERIAGRQALIVLDALAAGNRPGTVSVLKGSDVLRFATGRSMTKYESNAGELLATAALLGDLPLCCYVVGIQPGNPADGAGLSRDVQRSLQRALTEAQTIVDGLLVQLTEPVQA